MIVWVVFPVEARVRTVVNLEIFMQAKNYVAQILHSIEEKYVSGSASHFAKNIDDADTVISEIQKMISLSVAFNLPNDGVILDCVKDDGSYKPNIENMTKLPFNVTSLSFEGNNKTTKHFILAFEDNKNRINVISFFRMPKTNWQLLPSIVFCRKDELRTDLLFELKSEFDSKKESLNTLAMYAIKAFFEFLEALSCRNVEQTIIQKCDKALNARRINKGKLPLYEERILTIKVNAKQGTGTRTGTHESPRQHLRRGHIRRLESGNIWVNACVVGSSEKGVIKKSYNVAA